MTSRFIGGGSSFQTKGFVPDENRFNLGTSLTYKAPLHWEITADYDYEFRADSSAHSGYLKAACKFLQSRPLKLLPIVKKPN